VKASKSAVTRLAYQSDARDFSAWCTHHGLEPLPARVETVATYLAALASSGLKASTITRRSGAIAYVHRIAGFDPRRAARQSRLCSQAFGEASARRLHGRHPQRYQGHDRGKPNDLLRQ
jgi:hypothetical protein